MKAVLTFKAVCLILIASLAFSVAIDLSMEHPEGLVPMSSSEIQPYEGSTTPPDYLAGFHGTQPLVAGDGRIHLPGDGS
jgi:hypothetical protein